MAVKSNFLSVAAFHRAKEFLTEAFRNRTSILNALRRCKQEFSNIVVNRLQPKPKVMIIGEFWAMTTEGDGNYHLQKYLEREGAEVDIQLITAWVLYLIWQARYDVRRRQTLRGVDKGRKGLEGRNAKWLPSPACQRNSSKSGV